MQFEQGRCVWPFNGDAVGSSVIKKLQTYDAHCPALFTPHPTYVVSLLLELQAIPFEWHGR